MRKLRALSVVPVVLLTGCGVAGTQFHPGVAAEVGDRTISTRHLEQVTADYCQALEKVSKGQDGVTATPMRYLSFLFAKDLVTKAAAEQLADQYGVQPSDDYEQNLAQLEPQLAPLSEDQKDAVREVVEAQAYTQDVLRQIGDISLKKQGTTGANNDEKDAEGQKLLAQWADDHDVEINPRYGIDLGSEDPVDTAVSYALSSTAKEGVKGQPDASYTDALPDYLVCLD